MTELDALVTAWFHGHRQPLLTKFVMFWLSSRRDFSLSRRLGIVAAAVLMVLLVAVSRVYLGAHYLSDVLFAMVEGLLWLGFGIALLRSRLSSPNEGPHAPR